MRENTANLANRWHPCKACLYLRLRAGHFKGAAALKGQDEDWMANYHPWQVDEMKKSFLALANVAQCIERQPANQRVGGLVPSQGTCQGCGTGPQEGAHERQPHIDVSLPVSKNKLIKSFKNQFYCCSSFCFKLQSDTKDRHFPWTHQRRRIKSSGALLKKESERSQWEREFDPN